VVFDYTANHSGSDGPQIAALAHAVGLLGGFLSALLLRDEVSAARIAEYVRRTMLTV
jgi:membrane associated rhomboid family serine protease